MKCPSCQSVITAVTIQSVSGNVGFRPKWETIAYCCPVMTCQAILSVSIDPIAIKTDLVNEITAEIEKANSNINANTTSAANQLLSILKQILRQ